MAEREGRTNNPFMKFGRDLLEADKRASREKGKDKDGKYGPRPSTRALGAITLGIFGIAVEPVIDGLSTSLLEKYKVDKSKIPAWAEEVGKDLVAGVAYAVARKQLDQLPALTVSDFGVTALLDVGAAGMDRVIFKGVTAENKVVSAVRTGIGFVLKKTLGETRVNALDPSKVMPSALVNPVNPLTVGAVREMGSAVNDFVSAYRDIVNGVPEKAEEKKEPTVTKETTMIYIVPDMASASAMVNTTTGETVATS